MRRVIKMCQLHFICNPNKKLEGKDVREFLSLMCFGAFTNRDAWGVFDKDKVLREGGIFEIDHINSENFTQSNFLVGHNRLSTASIVFPSVFGRVKKVIKRGSQESMLDEKKEKVVEGEEELTPEMITDMQHHPFELGDFVMAHNGVISNARALFIKYEIKGKVRTDSYAILKAFSYHFEKISVEKEGSLDRGKRIVSSIRKVIKELRGSFSVIIYDKKEDKNYYFKNTLTNFTFCIVDNSIICGSTKKQNLKFIFPGKDKRYVTPESNAIYVIGGDTSLKRVGGVSGRQMEDNFLRNIFNKNGQDGEIGNVLQHLTGYRYSYEIIEVVENDEQGEEVRSMIARVKEPSAKKLKKLVEVIDRLGLDKLTSKKREIKFEIGGLL